MNEPKVTVVIPTYNRPHLVPRAVRSALAQTLAAIEVIVVLDGPDDATLQALREIEDQRLQVTVLPQNMGLADARNAGVQTSHCPWIAFLDDDDEWMPRKLDLQLEAALRSAHRYPIISCRFVAREGSGRFVWPRRIPRSGEHISEYMFCRHSPFFGEGIMLPSTLFVSTRLAQMIAFSSTARRIEDVDWLLRATAVQGVGVEFVPTPEPLAVWDRTRTLGRRSSRVGWRSYLSWIQTHQHLMTRRAYAGLVLTWAATGPARTGQRDAFWPLLREAFRNGKPAPMDVLTYLAYWLTPQRLQTFAASLLGKRGQRGSEMSGGPHA